MTSAELFDVSSTFPTLDRPLSNDCSLPS
jgi:hypothetical protein